MKKLIAVTTSLCATVCALGLGGATAFADDEAAVTAGFYPTQFEAVPKFDNLEDYAVGNGKKLFLQDNCIYEYESERVNLYENSRKTVIHLYFRSDEFYYETNDGSFYALKNFGNDDATEDIELSNPPTVELSDYYYFSTDDEYYVLDRKQPTQSPVLLDGFTNLKLFDNAVYAVKENVLYTLKGANYDTVKVEDFEITKQIKTGNAYKNLTSSAEQTPKFVSLKNGAYMTEVNLEKLTAESQTFEAGKTVKVSVADTPSALLLYTAGDSENGISIIAVDGKSYLIHPKDATVKTVYPFKDSAFNGGTTIECYLYSAPYETAGTRIMVLPSGANVKILNEIKISDNAELDNDFYYVEYEVDENTTVKGYVHFLLTYTFNENPPTTTTDPAESYNDSVKTVVLILMVLLLVFIAIGYLIYVGTSDKTKKFKFRFKKDKNGEEAPTDARQSDEQ